MKKAILICLLMSFLITGCGKGLKMTSGMPIKKEEKQQTQIQEKTDTTVHTNNQVQEKTDTVHTNNQVNEPSPTPNPPPDPDGDITTYDQPSMFERVTMFCPFLSQIFLSYVADKTFHSCGIALYALFPSLCVGGNHAILGFTLMSASYFIHPLVSIAFTAYAYKKGATNLPLVLMSTNSLFSLYEVVDTYIRG